MATADEYAAWIVKNSAKRGTPEFDTVAQAYQLAKGEEGAAATQQQLAPAPQEPSLGQQLIGAGETALALGTGAVGGTLGTLAGTLQGLSQQILSGNFGTPEAMRAVEKAASEGAQALTYQPRGQVGQEMTQGAGQFLANALPPVLPMIAAPGALTQAVRSATPITQATAQRGTAAVQQAARTTGQAIAKPVQAATTAMRETLGMEAPVIAQAAAKAPAIETVAPVTVEIPVGTSKTASLFDEWVEKSRTQDPQTKDVFSAINRRAQAAPDVDFELRMVKTSDAVPTQVGEDYLNPSSMNTAEKIAKSKSIQDIDRVEDVLPIRLDENMRIIDGNHRHAAAVLNKDEYIQALVPVGKGTGKVVNLESIKQGAPVGITKVAAPAAGARVSGGAAVTPMDLQRVKTAEQFDVNLTRGEALRDADQLAFEKEQLKGPLGAPLRNRAEESRLKLLQDFDSSIEKTGAESVFAGPSATGQTLVNALGEGYNAAKNKVNVLYKKARKSDEANAQVDPASIVKLGEGEDAIETSLIGYVNDRLQGVEPKIAENAKKQMIRFGIAAEDETGQLVPKQAAVKQLEDFRSEMVGSSDVTVRRQIRDETIIKKLVDATTEPVAGPLFKEARQARTEMGRKFENRAIVARLVKNRKGMDDPQVAADQVFKKSILGASPAEITFLKRVLQTTEGGGKQAWKELQGATLKHIRDKATDNVNTDSMGRPVLSADKLNKAIKELDQNGRLDVILGKDMAARVRDLNEVSQYINTVPPGTLINSSGTTMTLVAALGETGLLGGPWITGAREISKMIKSGKTKAKINEALNALPPVQP